MTNNRKVAGLNRRKLIPAIVIIVGVIIFSSFYLWYNFRGEPQEDDLDKIDNIDKLEFTILIENTHDIESINISWQLKNAGDNTFNFPFPILGANLYLYIIAANGTVYRSSDNFDSIWPLHVRMSPGEIKEGIIPEGLFTYNWNGKNVTYWQNQTTGEYWHFEPGTYEIYGEYESYAPNNSNIKDGSCTLSIENF